MGAPPRGDKSMTTYRFSLLGADGSIDAGVTLPAATDDAAAEIATDLLMESASATIEVWENERLVFRVGRVSPNSK